MQKMLNFKIQLINQFLEFFKSFKILLIKLKCNKDHIYGVNRVLASIIIKNKIHYMAIRFFLQHLFLENEREITR
jgi:hypothetical protein